MAKTYTDWGDKAKHTISLAQHKKNVAAKAGGASSGGGGPLPDAARVTARARRDPGFLQRALKNPGLRSRITDINLLPKDLQQERTLNAPIFPGSGVTGRDLTRRATDETTAAYAAPEADLAAKAKTAQQHQGDVDAWWNQYQAAVTDAAGRIGGAQDQMVGGAQGIQQGIQGLGQAQIGGILDQAAKTAAPGVGPTASLASEANRAQVARETLAGSYLGQAQQQAAASKGFADYQAGVVAPAYRILGRNETQRGIDAVGAQQSALAVKKGADLLKTRADIRQQEIANTVALGQLGNQTLNAQTSAAANTPAGKGAAAAATEEAKMAAKYGKTTHQWRLLGPTGRAQLIAKSDKTQTKPGSDVITSGPLAGKTKTWVAAHPDAAGALVDAYNKKGGKSSKPGQGPDWVPQTQMGAVLTQASQLKDLAAKAKGGLKFKPTGKETGPGKPLPRNGPNGAAQKIQAYVGSAIKDPIILTAALDAIYDGHLSPATIRGLIAAKYQPGRVAKALGVPTAGQMPRNASTSSYARPPKPATTGSRGDSG